MTAAEAWMLYLPDSLNWPQQNTEHRENRTETECTVIGYWNDALQIQLSAGKAFLHGICYLLDWLDNSLVWKCKSDSQNWVNKMEWQSARQGVHLQFKPKLENHCEGAMENYGCCAAQPTPDSRGATCQLSSSVCRLSTCCNQWFKSWWSDQHCWTSSYRPAVQPKVF